MYENIGSDTYPLEAETKAFFEKAAAESLEMRQGQVEMALEICEAIKAHKPLAVDAEVGIGKSYAYLVPAVMEHSRTHRQIIIATSTIALQEQLMKDSKSVMKMIGTSIEITVIRLEERSRVSLTNAITRICNSIFCHIPEKSITLSHVPAQGLCC